MSPARHHAKWLRGSALLAALIGLAACGGTTTPSDGDAVDPGQPTIVGQGPGVSARWAAVPSGDPVAQASIFETAQLWLVADWPGAPADQVERVEIRTPEGGVYQVTEISFGESTRGDVQVQVLADGTRRVALALQIWGTSIEQLQRTGGWSATVSLVGGDASAAASVALTP